MQKHENTGTQDVMSGRWRILRVLALLPVPVVFAIFASLYIGLRGPLYLAANNDPSYIYLSNGLLVLDGESPYHTDHPGTPLQILCAAVTEAKHPGPRAEAISAALKDPEGTLQAIAYTILVICTLGLFWFGYRVAEDTDSLAGAVLAQAGILLVPDCLRSFGKVAPECFLVGMTFIYTGLVLWRGTRELSGRQSRAAALLVAAATGLCIATKITFVPLALISLFPWRGLKKAVVHVLWVTAFTFVGWLPVVKSLPRIFGWFLRLATHVGQYGGGSSGFIDRSAYLPSARNLLSGSPALAWIWVGTALVFGLCAWAGRSEKTRRIVVWGFAVLLAQVLSLAMVAKQPSPHYLQPALATVPLLIALTVLAIRQSSVRPAVRFGGLVVLLLAMAVPARSAFMFIRAQFASDALRGEHYLHYEKESRRLTGGAQIIEYYSSSSIPYALDFANGWARNQFSADLTRLYPRYICLNIFNGQFGHFNRIIEPAKIFVKGKPVYLSGTDDVRSAIRNGVMKLPPGWGVELLYTEEHCFLFRADYKAPAAKAQN